MDQVLPEKANAVDCQYYWFNNRSPSATRISAEAMFLFSDFFHADSTILILGGICSPAKATRRENVAQSIHRTQQSTALPICQQRDVGCIPCPRLSASSRS
jgi:uncharacterized membrane protein